jgi:flagellar protein FlaG
MGANIMISTVANFVGFAPGNAAQPAPAVEVNQKQSAPVELPQQAVKAVESEVNAEMVKNSLDQLNKLVRQFNRNLEFTVDEDTGVNIVKVIDSQSQEVIRQMPTEEMLAIAKALDKLQGLLIKDKA